MADAAWFSVRKSKRVNEFFLLISQLKNLVLVFSAECKKLKITNVKTYYLSLVILLVTFLRQNGHFGQNGQNGDIFTTNGSSYMSPLLAFPGV